ncbi:inorganic pyrophosphatase [Dunaliella salina]|uniref:inorganic diphosphatase n=1 Tax=Dunaliella salina TaxID=3046 RepID=A0ABQ7GCT4_DUNSA|nr:inorganic pyrophosphatase [Dunaliella salina]|eukprot:KAF5832414.1 inorganic pyrophosphatase [Dunaliella salina]
MHDPSASVQFLALGLTLAFSWAFQVKEYRTEKVTEGPFGRPVIYFKQGAKIISPWHEIPLYARDGNLHYICEIPKWTSAKMEVAIDEECTPIKQDVNDKGLRFYPIPSNWNYGLLPQGDKDPVDVMEISSKAHHQGDVYEVKPLGVYAVIDGGKLDWKVIAISLDDPLAELVNDAADIEMHLPGELEAIKIWLSKYKESEGISLIKFGYHGKCLDRKSAQEVINETHELYGALKSGARLHDGNLSLI